MDEGSRYDVDIDLEQDTSHTLIFRAVGAGKRVLDVGCWNGDLGALLATRNIRVVGVELDPDAAAIAAGRLDHVIVGNVEALDLEEALGRRSFDVIVFGDVLEHLVDPVGVLRRLRPLIAPGGYVVASLPNVAHGSVRLALLDGRFEYTDVGLLDRTHLRFFTRETLPVLFEDAGYAVTEVQTTTIDPLLAPERPREEASVDPVVLATVRADPDAHVYQFVVKAVVDDATTAVRNLWTRVGEQERRLRAIQLRERLVDGTDARPRIVHVGLAGAVGNDDVGARILCRVLEHELEQRWTVEHVSVVPLLGDRRLEYSGVMDCIVDLAPSIDSELERSSFASTLDLGLATVLAGDGVTGAPAARPSLDALALLAHRLVKEDDLEPRRRLLGLTGMLPSAEGYALVALGETTLSARDASDISTALAESSGVATFTRTSANDAVLGALPSFFASRVTELDPDIGGDDALAVIAGASAVATDDPVLALVALSLGVRHACLTESGDTVMAAIDPAVVDDAASARFALAIADPRREALAVGARIDAEVHRRLDEVAAALAPSVSAASAAARREPLLHDLVAGLQARVRTERAKFAAAFIELEEEYREQLATGPTLVELEVTRTALEQLQRAFIALELGGPGAEPGPPPPGLEAYSAKRLARNLVGRALRRARLRR